MQSREQICRAASKYAEPCANMQSRDHACRACMQRNMQGVQLLHAVFQLRLQFFKLFFKSALAGTHDPVVDKEDDADKGECTEKKGVTHALKRPA